MDNQIVLPLTGHGSEAHLAAVLHDCRFAGGVAASGQSGEFGGMLFLRDTCRMVRNVLSNPNYRPFAREMLSILPQWQGVKEDPSTNEFPDALSHQVVREFVGGRRLDQGVLDNAEYWSGKWGVEMSYSPQFGKHFVIYNSSDGPPLYLITLGEYIAAAGDDSILRDEFYHWPSDNLRRVAEAASRCAGYILDRIGENDFGLYSVPNTNPKQTSPSGVMRDGWDAYFYPEDGGRLLDYSNVTYFSNQALVYRALKMLADVIFPKDEKVKLWQETAAGIRSRAIDRMWDGGSFAAAALDKDGRKVRMQSSDVAESLNERFYEGHTDEDFFVGSIVRWLYSPQVMTPIGPRMVSLEQSFFEEDEERQAQYYAYQLTGAVWSVANASVAGGTYKHQLYQASYDLGPRRTLGWYVRAEGVPELTFVHRQTNQPVYDLHGNQASRQKARYVIAASQLGQDNQGWGASGGLEMHFAWKQHAELPQAPTGSWQRRLDDEAAEMAEAVPPASAGEPVHIIYVDLEEGQRIRDERAEKFGAAAA